MKSIYLSIYLYIYPQTHSHMHTHTYRNTCKLKDTPIHMITFRSLDNEYWNEQLPDFNSQRNKEKSVEWRTLNEKKQKNKLFWIELIKWVK